MSILTRYGWLLITLAILVGPVQALDVGDPAPALSIASWIKGGPVDLAVTKGKNVVILEFWATWCMPCRESIPHLTELQKKYKDQGLIIAGISDEPEETIRPFVTQAGSHMDYSVGADNRRGTLRAYMAAARVPGVPYAFIIDKTGALIWHGHPADGMDGILERVLAGKYTVETAKAAAKAAKLLEEYLNALQNSLATKDEAERKTIAESARKTGEELLKVGKSNPQKLNELSWTIMMVPELPHRDLDLAGRAAEAAFGESEKAPADKVRKLMHDYFRAVIQTQSPASQPAAGAVSPDTIGTAILKEGKDQPALLNDFCWALLVAPVVKNRDLKLASRVIEAAVTATDGKDASVLDTQARAFALMGQPHKAVEASKKAVELNKDPRLEPHLRAALQEFEKTAATAPAK